MVNIGNDIDFLKIGRKTQMIHIRMYMCVKCGYILSFNFIQSECTPPKNIWLNVRTSWGGVHVIRIIYAFLKIKIN